MVYLLQIKNYLTIFRYKYTCAVYKNVKYVFCYLYKFILNLGIYYFLICGYLIMDRMFYFCI